MSALVACILLGASTFSPAAPESREEAVARYAETTATSTKDWQVGLSLYGWLTGFSVDVDGERIRAGFGDVLDVLNSGIMLRATGRWRGWTGYVDYLYGNLGDATAIDRGTATLSVIQHNVDFRVGRVVGEWREGESRVSLIVEAGARWWYTRTIVSIDIPPLLPGGEGVSDSVRETSSWWDPLVGLRVSWRISPRAAFSAHLNVGGFGIGEASDFAWDLGFVFVFRLGGRFWMPLGYRILEYERSDDGVDLKNTLQGPIIGISFTF